MHKTAVYVDDETNAVVVYLLKPYPPYEVDYTLFPFHHKSSYYDFENKLGAFATMVKTPQTFKVVVGYKKDCENNFLNILKNMSMVGFWSLMMDYKHMSDTDFVFTFSDSRDAVHFRLLIV